MIFFGNGYNILKIFLIECVTNASKFPNWLNIFHDLFIDLRDWKRIKEITWHDICHVVQYLYTQLCCDCCHCYFFVLSSWWCDRTFVTYIRQQSWYMHLYGSCTSSELLTYEMNTWKLKELLFSRAWRGACNSSVRQYSKIVGIIYWLTFV